MKKIIGLIACLLFGTVLYSQQGINNMWLMGYYGGLGETKIDFYSGTAVINQNNIPMDFNHTLATIADNQGNLLFYTNGAYIADATNDTMMNGSGINPGVYANLFPDGFLIPQAAIIISKPGSNNIYYMFHSTVDNPPNYNTASYLYLSIIDINQNNGKGAVIVKNYILISDSLNGGKLTATKHANGRDWWVVCHRVNSNKYYKLLVTPNGLPTVDFQNIGSIREWDAGQAKFSSDGTKFAYYHYRFTGLDIFDFDRCSGQFSNWINDSLPLVVGNVGCEFSPSSQFLYITNILKVYQYDVTNVNVLATRTEVAVWDSFAQPGIPQLGAYLCIPQLAPDGKIYITTGNGTTYMGRINNPDMAGIACDVAQHSVILPTFYFNTLPNHPNYFLGNLPGSSCDTLNWLGMEETEQMTMAAYPNPSDGIFTLKFPVNSETGVLEIYDVNGRMIHEESVAPWSQFKRVEISKVSSGIYFCKMRWKDREGSVKVIKE